jgi:hypothetical protein
MLACDDADADAGADAYAGDDDGRRKEREVRVCCGCIITKIGGKKVGIPKDTRYGGQQFKKRHAYGTTKKEKQKMMVDL